MGNRLTIQEVIDITGKSKTAIYRIIKNGKLKTYKREKAGKPIYEVDIKDLEEFLGHQVGNRWEELGKSGKSSGNRSVPLTEEKLIETIERMFSQRETALMKRIEDMSIYKLGQMDNEINHLKAEKETLLQELETYKALPVEDVTAIKEENIKLQEKLKALPLPVEEVTEKIQYFEQQVTKLQQEKEKTTSALLEEKSIREQTELEYSQLKQKVNTLPVSIDEIPVKLSQKEEAISKLQEEKQSITETITRLEDEKTKLEEQLKLLPAEPEKVNATLLHNAEHLLLLKIQNEEIEKKYNEMESSLKAEEQSKKDMEEQLKLLPVEPAKVCEILKLESEKFSAMEEKCIKEAQEKEFINEQKKKLEEENQKLKDTIKQAEQDKIEIANTFKKELEEARRPWWKKIFG